MMAMVPPIAMKIGMVPKISARPPARRTGIKERPCMTAPKIEKTLPLTCSVVFSCKTVWEGTMMETMAMPRKKAPTARIVDKLGW